MRDWNHRVPTDGKSQEPWSGKDSDDEGDVDPSDQELRQSLRDQYLYEIAKGLPVDHLAVPKHWWLLFTLLPVGLAVVATIVLFGSSLTLLEHSFPRLNQRWQVASALVPRSR